jgi:hypothetical protein
MVPMVMMPVAVVAVVPWIVVPRVIVVPGVVVTPIMPAVVAATPVHLLHQPFRRAFHSYAGLRYRRSSGRWSEKRCCRHQRGAQRQCLEHLDLPISVSFMHLPSVLLRRSDRPFPVAAQPPFDVDLKDLIEHERRSTWSCREAASRSVSARSGSQLSRRQINQRGTERLVEVHRAPRAHRRHSSASTSTAAPCLDSPREHPHVNKPWPTTSA